MVSIPRCGCQENRRDSRPDVVAEIVEQQERVELAGLAEAEGAVQLHAGAFHGGRGLDDPLDRSDGHGPPVSMVIGLYLGIGPRIVHLRVQ